MIIRLSEVMDEKHPRKYIEPKDIGRYSINRIRYIEYGTKRSSKKCCLPRFPEHFIVPKLFVNKIGTLIVTLDIHNLIYNDTMMGIVLWKDLIGIENKSITGIIKKYSRHTRQKMEALSKQVNLYYLLAILNSTYANHLLEVQRGGD